MPNNLNILSTPPKQTYFPQGISNKPFVAGVNIFGMKYNMLTIIGTPFTIKRNRYVECLCDCGTIKTIGLRHITTNKIKSCGCLNKELSKSRNTTHGLVEHKIYEVWQNIKRRCYFKKSKGYKRYGGRGITVCNEWKDNFINFYNWAVLNGWSKDLQIDRINNDGNYEPDNCRFVTNLINNHNRRCVTPIEKRIEIKNEYFTKNCTMNDLSLKYGIGTSTVCNIIHDRNWRE